MCGADGPNQVQVSRELLALRVLNREPLGTEDSSESSPLTPEVRGSLGEAEGGTTGSQLEEGGMRRQGVHPGGEEPAAMQTPAYAMHRASSLGGHFQPSAPVTCNSIIVKYNPDSENSCGTSSAAGSPL